MNVTIDKNHIYHVDGKTPPSVSSVLDLYFPPSQFYTEDGRQRGSARHEWYHLLAQGVPIENEPDPRIAGEVAAFRKYMAEVKPEYVSGEVPYYDPILNVCGTPDKVCRINSRLAVVDFKPKARNKRTQLQTAGYKRILAANKIFVQDRYELRLYDDGKYRFEQHKDAGDEQRWPLLVGAFHACSFYR